MKMCGCWKAGWGREGLPQGTPLDAGAAAGVCASGQVNAGAWKGNTNLDLTDVARAKNAFSNKSR